MPDCTASRLATQIWQSDLTEGGVTIRLGISIKQEALKHWLGGLLYTVMVRSGRGIEVGHHLLAIGQELVVVGLEGGLGGRLVR